MCITSEAMQCRQAIVQNTLNNILTKYCVVEDSYIRSLKQNFNIIGIEMWV